MAEKTIREVSELWRSDKKQYVKQSTYSAYSLILDIHLIPYFGDSVRVEEEDVQHFVNVKLGEGMAQRTIHGLLVVLKMVVRFGAKMGLGWNSEWEINFPTTGHAKEIEVLTVMNQKKLLQYIESNFSFRNLGIYICLSCGLRIGEVCALKWSDVDVTDGVIRVNKTIERVSFNSGQSRYTKVLIGTPKTHNSIREVPISRGLMKLLRPLTRVVNGDCYILSNDVRPIEPRTYRNYYNRLIDELEIPRIKFHGLRHSFATRCIQSNCDYKTVSVLLGHSNVGTTLNLYVHPNLEQKKKCIDKAMKYFQH